MKKSAAEQRRADATLAHRYRAQVARGKADARVHDWLAAYDARPEVAARRERNRRDARADFPDSQSAPDSQSQPEIVHQPPPDSQSAPPTVTVLDAGADSPDSQSAAAPPAPAPEAPEPQAAASSPGQASATPPAIDVEKTEPVATEPTPPDPAALAAGAQVKSFIGEGLAEMSCVWVAEANAELRACGKFSISDHLIRGLIYPAACSLATEALPEVLAGPHGAKIVVCAAGGFTFLMSKKLHSEMPAEERARRLEAMAAQMRAGGARAPLPTPKRPDNPSPPEKPAEPAPEKPAEPAPEQPAVLVDFGKRF